MTTEAEARGEIEKSIENVTEILEQIIDLIKKLAGDKAVQENRKGRSRRSATSPDGSELSTLQTLENVTNTVSAVLVVLFIHYISVSIQSDGVTIVDGISYGVGSMVTIVVEKLETVRHKIMAAYAVRAAASTSAFFVSILSEEARINIEKAAERVFANTIVKTVGDALKDIVEQTASLAPTAVECIIEGIETLIKHSVPGEKFFDTVKQAIAIMASMSRTRPSVSQECNILLRAIDETVGRLYRSAENIIVLTRIVYDSRSGGADMRLHLHRHYYCHSHRHKHKRTYPLTFKLPFLPR